MTATNIASIENKHKSYYRSQLYTSYHGINPLVTAAHPIFSIIERVKLSSCALDVDNFYNNLHHELKAFEARAENHDYDHETIFISRYLLSATLDEIIIQSGQFKLFKLLMPKNDSLPPPDQNFFKILDKVIDKPNHYLDLLELIYLCLSLGFQGRYREKEHEKLKEITEHLYQTITPLRKVEKRPKVSLHVAQPKKTKFWKLSISIILGVGIAFCLSNYFLNQKAQQLYQQLAEVSDESK